MYRNNGMDINLFVNTVHNKMKIKYLNSSKLEAEKKKALKLQDFFQDLKLVAQNGTPNKFDKAILEEILDTIENDGTVMRKGSKITNLFQRRGGITFEKELESIYEAVWTKVSKEPFDLSKVAQGKTKTNISSSGITNLSKDIVERFGVATYHAIKSDSNKATLREYYLPDVAGKVDVKGYTIKISGNASPEIKEIYRMLKDASFSAKNYDSMTYDQKLEIMREMQGPHASSLALGKSNIYRALYGALSGLGYSERTINNAIIAGFDAIQANQDTTGDIQTHFYHMRYLYELMGVGTIQENGQKATTVKYLIYNDPSGSIYVRSVLEIMHQVLQDLLEKPSKWDSTIKIEKSWMQKQ